MTSLERPAAYGDSLFSAASALPLTGGLGSARRLGRLLTAALRRPSRLWALLVILVRTPRVDLALTDGVEGRYLRRYFGQRFAGVFPQRRYFQGVLTLPKSTDAYGRGNARRALRNNLRRAQRAGISCGPLDSAAETLAAMRQIVRARQASITAADHAGLAHVWPGVLSQPGVSLFGARDATGMVIAVVAAVIDAEAALLLTAVASDHAARWALHHHLAELLITRHVTYVLAASEGSFGAMTLPAEVQYYQRLLGYELRHVRART
jgi:hypothetical protein